MRILIFGDSITQGFHDDEMSGWCSRLALRAQQKTVQSDLSYDTSVFNLGISGDNTEGLVARIDVELSARLRAHEGAVVFAIGVNDSQYEVVSNKNRVELDAFTTNLQSCIEKAKQYAQKIYVLSILPIDDTLLSPMPWKPTHGYSQKFVDVYNHTLKQIISSTEVSLIDMSDVLGENHQEYLPDGIHPNAEGHRRIFEKVKGVLEADNLL